MGQKRRITKSSKSKKKKVDLLKYDWSGWMSAAMCEVMIPKKTSYKSKLREVLDALFDKNQISAAPVMRLLKLLPNIPELIDPDKLVGMFGGYSIYEADGRFINKDGEKVDERVLIIRIIFIGESSQSQKFIEAVRFYVSYRLAVELGTEDEVWTMVYNTAQVGIFKDAPRLQPVKISSTLHSLD